MAKRCDRCVRCIDLDKDTCIRCVCSQSDGVKHWAVKDLGTYRGGARATRPFVSCTC